MSQPPPPEASPPDAAPVGTSSGPPATRRGFRRLRSHAWWIAGAYGLFATLWIIYSDRALGALFDDPEILLRWSVVKGIAFVALTATMLLLMIRKAYGRIEDGYATLKQHKVEIERLSRLYAALSHISQAIVSTRNREELFERVCAVLVAEGGFRLAWIGWHDAGTRTLAPVASAGDVNGYLDAATIATDDPPHLRGPAATAFCEGRLHLCHDLLNASGAKAWRDEAMRRGLRSSASIPIRSEGEVAGTLSVYANESGFFTGKEETLLLEAGRDLSFALDNLAREKERVAAEEKLRRGEERYRSTLDSILEGCQIIGHDWRYLYLNGAAEAHNRRSNRELLGRTMQEAWPGIEATDAFAAIRGALEDRTAFHGETSFTFPDGSSGWFDLRAEPVPEGVFILSVEVTERHEAEDALRTLNRKLEQLVEERTAELQAALVRAEAADRLKSAFLATMSHELRTPLNSIIGFTGILLQGLAGEVNDEQRKQLGMVQTSARHLLELINDVLDLSKIEAGQFAVACEPFSLPESLEQVVASMAPIATKKGVGLESAFEGCPETMTGDRRRLEQILFNLLNNAIKFTDCGRVRLSVRRLPGGGSDTLGDPSVEFEVSDTGIGIEPEELETIFQPFRQIDHRLSRDHEGTGLGLTICRRLAELMGGRISAESEPGRGSVFTLTLPVNRGLLNEEAPLA